MAFFKMTTNLLMGIVPLLSVILAVIFINHPFVGGISGSAYFLYPLMMWIHTTE